MKTTKAFWAAFWSGVSTPAAVFSAPTIPVLHIPTENRSDLDAMRGDWMKIGGDISGVITREKAATHTS